MTFCRRKPKTVKRVLNISNWFRDATNKLRVRTCKTGNQQAGGPALVILPKCALNRKVFDSFNINIYLILFLNV